MASLYEMIFGNLPERTAKQPSSRGAMPGLQPYQQMPDANASITDMRSQGVGVDPRDLRVDFRSLDGAAYSPSFRGGGKTAPTGLSQFDPMLGAGPSLAQGSDAESVDPYKPSFRQNLRPSLQAPYNPFNAPPLPYGDQRFGTDAMGPNLPRGGVDYGNRASDLPYIGAHLPIAPGDPHWTSPPSASGPHNRQGDPARPGYDSPVMPMDFSSVPGMSLISVPWQ